MFKFNLLIFVRQLWRYKRFSIASFVGLVAGVTAFLVVLLFANEINRYNNWNPTFGNIFELRYNKPFKTLGTSELMKHQSPMLSRYLGNYADVVSFCRIKEKSSTFVQTPRATAFEDNVMFADSAFFRIFPFRFLYGNPITVLDSIHNVVVSERIAFKYFGRSNCLGAHLRLGNDTVMITGVLDENGPTTFPIDIVGTLTIPSWAQKNGWGNFAYKYYCQLSPQVAVSQDKQDSLALHISQQWYSTPQVFESQATFIGLGKDYETWNRNPDKVRMHFFSVKKLYLEDKKTLFWILIAIGITVLLLCCFDYTNKQIGFSDTRNIEVGVKSLNGWTPVRMVLQVLWETTLFVAVAFFCACIVVELLLPFINNLLDVDIKLYKSICTFSFQWKFIVFFILVILMAGTYPAFYMASLRPIAVLKGDYQGEDRGYKFRLGLLSFQLVLGMTILIVLGSVLSQINFLKNKSIGYDYHNLYYVRLSSIFNQNLQLRKKLDNVVAQMPVVSAHAYSSQMPLVDASNNFELIRTKDSVFNCLTIDNDNNLFQVMRTLSMEGKLPNISGNEIIVNERFVETLHLKAPVIGQTVRSEVPPSFAQDDTTTYVIKGIVENILYQSWEFKDYPIFYTGINKHDDLFLIVRTNGVQDLLPSMLEKELLRVFPEEPFQVLSSENDFNASFKQLNFLSKVLSFFTVLIVVGVILGFSTYANFYFQRRKKEMVLRMLAGANANNFFRMFSKNIIVYFILSVMLSWSISFFVLKIFFAHFAFVLPYPYWLYIGVPLFFLGLSVLILLLSIEQVLRRAPAEVLRYE
ncbi:MULTISPECIES: ABC transporter permease [Chitinophagaceae]